MRKSRDPKEGLQGMEEGQPRLSDTLLGDNYPLPTFGMDESSYPTLSVGVEHRFSKELRKEVS